LWGGLVAVATLIGRGPLGVMRVAMTLVMAATLALGACSPAATSLGTRTVSLGGETWTVYEGTGAGMRGLPGFGGADGMLFDMGREVDPAGVAFTMEGVGFPIDIAWFDAAGSLVSIASMVPCEAVPCPLYRADGPYRWAVEAPVGGFADLVPADRLVVDQDAYLDPPASIGGSSRTWVRRNRTMRS
jgi:uncharacterized membrane protein (UPF0127 family)